MKSILFTLTSAALFSSLITALPTQQQPRAASEVAIVIKTGDGDSSVGASVPIGKLVPASSQASKGVAASVSSDPTISCQAFSDAAGNTKLGAPFTTVTTVQFGKSSGGTESIASDAVPIGAFCCVLTKDGFGACSSSSNNNNNNNNNESNTPPSKSKTVRVQLNGASEASAQGEVPADNSVFLLALNPPFFTEVSDGFIQNAEGLKGATCQGFSDMMGTRAVGATFGEEGVAFSGGKVARVVALRCKSA